MLNSSISNGKIKINILKAECVTVCVRISQVWLLFKETDELPAATTIICFRSSSKEVNFFTKVTKKRPFLKDMILPLFFLLSLYYYKRRNFTKPALLILIKF